MGLNWFYSYSSNKDRKCGKKHSKCKTIAACNFTAPAGIFVKLDEVLFCPVIMRQLNALNASQTDICFLRYSPPTHQAKIIGLYKFLFENNALF